MSGRVRSWLSAAALTVAALSGASCKKPATGLRVLVTTDFSPSSTTPPLHSVIVRVSDVRTGAELIADTINVLDGAATLPLKFSVFLTTAASDRVRIEAEAHTVDTQANPRNPDGSTRALTAARVVTGFVEGQIRVVPLVLYRGCWDARLACTPDTTCGPSAMCESANRDPNTLPAFDRDAGDPTDVFTPASDAATTSEAGSDSGGMDATVDGGHPDGALPPSDVIAPPACTAPLTAPTLTEVLDVANGTTADPRRIDIVSRTNMMAGMGMPTPNAIEVFWAHAPSGMMQNVSVAQVTNGAVSRAAARDGTSVRPGLLDVLSGYAIMAGMSERVGVIVGVRDTPTNFLGVAGSVLEGAQLGSPSGYLLPMGVAPPGELLVWSNALVFTNPVPDAVTPTTVTACVPSDTNTAIYCYRSTGAMGGLAVRIDLPPMIVGRNRIVAMTDSMGEVKFVVERGGGEGLATCSAIVPMMGNSTRADCSLVSGPSSGRVVLGSTSAVWINGMFNCPSGGVYSGGWWGVTEVDVGGANVLYAGQIAGSIESLSMRSPVSTASASRTALGIAPAACEMLVSRAIDAQVEFRRARLGTALPSSATTLAIDPTSVLRSTGLAPRGAMDDHYVAFVAGGVVKVYRSPAPCR